MFKILFYTVLDSVFSRHHNTRKSTASSKGNNHNVPSKKNWIYNRLPPASQAVTSTPLAAPYSAAYYRQALARKNLQSSRASSFTSSVQQNQPNLTDKVANVRQPGPTNRFINQQAVNSIQQQFKNARVKNDVLGRQQFRWKALREG